MSVKKYFLIFFSLSAFGSDYISYEFRYDKESEKLKIFDDGNYIYKNNGIQGGCFNFNGEKKGRFKNLSFKSLVNIVKKYPSDKNDRTSVVIKNKKSVDLIKPGKKAIKKLNEYLKKAIFEGKSFSGVSVMAKRLNDKKIKMNFRYHGNKKQELLFPKNLNSVFNLKGIELNTNSYDQLITLSPKNNTFDITLEAQQKLPKYGAIRFNDAALKHHKSRMEKYKNIHLCTGFKSL
jgi:hypothetical protein